MRLLAVVVVMVDMIVIPVLPEDKQLETLITVTLMPVLLEEDKVILMLALLEEDKVILIPALLEEDVVTEMPALLGKDMVTEMPVLLEEDCINSNPMIVVREGKRGVNTSYRLRWLVSQVTVNQLKEQVITLAGRDQAVTKWEWLEVSYC